MAPGAAHFGAGAVPTPADLAADLSYWIESDDVASSGGLISRFNEKSGHATHWDAGSTARPTLVAPGGGAAPYAEFNGTSNALQLVSGKTADDLITAGAFTLWFVARASAIDTSSGTTQSNDALISHGLGYWGVHLKSAPTVGGYVYGAAPVPNNGDHYAPVAIVAGTTYLVRVTYGSNTLTTYVGGVGSSTPQTVNAVAVTGNTAFIGKSGTGPQYFAGRLYASLGAKSLLAPAKLALVDAYLADKYGVAA